MEIRNEIKQLENELIEVRRELHKIPEIGFSEVKTKEFIKSYLEKLNPDYLETGIGIKAIFGKDDKETIAFRADIDALPVLENTGLEFASEHKGFMHACGHDGHTAILLLFAKYVSKHRNEMKKRIVLLFQPSEENGRGSMAFIKDSALENPAVKEIYGLHIWPEFEKHKYVINPGAEMSGMINFVVTFTGKSAHGAMPHLGNDAIVAAASFIMNTQTIVSRNISPLDSAVLTAGKIEGGKAPNVLADEVKISYTMRAFSEEIMYYMKDLVIKHANNTADSYGVKADIEFEPEAIPVVNDKGLANKVISMLDGKEVITDAKVTPSEDFARYQKETKGLFILLGSGDEEHKAALHSANYILNEEILIDGVELFARIAEA